MTTGDLFADLDGFVTLPRVAGLWLSPDGQRLVVGVSTLNHDRTRFVSALWEVDPAGEWPARRLTRSDEGEGGAAFTKDGDVLFVSARPRPDKKDSLALWRLPRTGEPELLAAPPGGVRGVVVAREAGTVVLGAPMLPSADSPEKDEELHRRRRDAAVKAILHDEFPVRYWDHDLGPARTRLLAGRPGDLRDLRDLTGHVGRAIHDDASWDITPDGRTIVTTWAVAEPGASQRATLVAIDVETGARRVLADDDHEYDQPRISPDGTLVAVVVRERPTAERIGDNWLAVVPVAGGTARRLENGDRWPHSAQWTPDGTALVFVADHRGHAPLWRITIATNEVTRLTETGAFSAPKIAPDGTIYALHSGVDHPPAPCRVTTDGQVQPLQGPGPAVQVPGTIEEVTAATAEGVPLRAWLALPDTDGPAPMLLWIHGGPIGSWNDWHWRWNPWVAVARGYAVLLPDPAISTGYGLDFIQRGWGQWGGTPYTDLMTITDAAVARANIDETRTAAMGGSYGGYMANWVAGHTDRFRAIVTHASLWHMDQMGSTTDGAYEWVREMTPEKAAEQSPHRFVDRVSTPMLVIHGDKDYRVPIGQALTLWWDLTSRNAGEHKFLYFPDEGHWIEQPGHVKVWYETVLAFLAHHLLGARWQPPEMLG